MLGLAPLPAPPDVFLVAPDHLRLARFEREGGLRLRTAARQSLEPEVFSKAPLGAVEDAERLGEAIRQAMESAGTRPRVASLVLPDRWLRLSLLPIEGLPPTGRDRQEMIRFKLRRLVPFRVDGLRVDGVDLPALPGSEDEGQPVMVGFAAEALIGPLERAMRGAGVRLGHVTNRSLATAECLEGEIEAGGLVGLGVAGPRELSLTFFKGGQPILARYKEWPEEVAASRVMRDLRLTRGFLQEHYPGEAPEFYLLSEELSGDWHAWLEEGLGAPIRVLHRDSMILDAEPSALPWSELVPMAGLARRKIR